MLPEDYISYVSFHITETASFAVAPEESSLSYISRGAVGAKLYARLRLVFFNLTI